MNCRPCLAGEKKSSIIGILTSILIGVKLAPVVWSLAYKAVILEIFCCLCLGHQRQILFLNHLADWLPQSYWYNRRAIPRICRIETYLSEYSFIRSWEFIYCIKRLAQVFHQPAPRFRLLNNVFSASVRSSWSPSELALEACLQPSAGWGKGPGRFLGGVFGFIWASPAAKI